MFSVPRIKKFDQLCNQESVALESLSSADATFLDETLREFVDKTGSELAKNILDNWSEEKQHFVKVSIHKHGAHASLRGNYQGR